MLFTILPAGAITTFAADRYGLWVNGVQITSENAGNVLNDGTVSYDVGTNTLTLNGAELDTPNPTEASSLYAAGIYAEGDINIMLTGSNSITISGRMFATGIHANGVITIGGNGTLVVNASGASSETRAISTGYTEGEAGVVINSGTIMVNASGGSSTYAVYLDDSYGTTPPIRYFRINGGMVELNTEPALSTSCWATNTQPDFSGYEGYSAVAILNSWEELGAYAENSWSYYRYIKVQPLVYDENGISEDKNHYQPATQAADGYYEIGNAGNLFWFAEKLRESDDNGTLNARLVSDITMPEGMNWVAMQVGTYGTPYNGIFDGAGYTISNLNAESDNGAFVFNNEGLFKTIGASGTVKNLGMINPSVKPDSGYAGAICGTNYGLIENCYNLGGEISAQYTWAGGIAGENEGTIRQCYNTGTVSSATGSSIGGLAGYSHNGGRIVDCYNTGDITGTWYVGGICGQLNGGTIENCYGIGTATATYPGYESTANLIVGGRLSGDVDNTYYINATENNAGGKTEAQFASGKVAYLLQGDREAQVWGQDIGTDNLPQLTGNAAEKVFRIETAYSQDGSIDPSISYANTGDTVTLQEAEPNYGYHFDEWAVDTGGVTVADDQFIMGRSDVSIEATFEQCFGKATYFQENICPVCGTKYGTYLTDTTPPTGEIVLGENRWTQFLDTISFGLFFDETQTVEITATDDSYEHEGYEADEHAVKIAYYIHEGNKLTMDELNAMDAQAFTEYTGSFDIDRDTKCVIYVRLTDHADNVTYLSSNGLILDMTEPTFTGVENGASYCTTQKVQVTDDNLASVTVNGQQVTLDANGTFTLAGNTDVEYVITITDKAGNETVFTVTMQRIETLREALGGIAETNATSADRETVQEYLDDLTERQKDSKLTSEEKTILNKLAEEAQNILDQLDAAQQASSAETIEQTQDVTVDNVVLDDKMLLEQAKEDIEQALTNFGDNYTEDEKAKLEESLARVEETLAVIGRVEDVMAAIEALPDTVSPDETEVEERINAVKEQYDALSEYEKSLISAQTTDKLESLLAQLVDYRIVEGDGSTWTKGSGEGLTFAANGAYEKFVGVEIDGAIINEEYYTVADGRAVITLKPDYLSTLTVGEHTIAMIYYTDGKAQGTFTVDEKPDDGSASPGTGDDSHIAFWLMVTLVSCGAVLILNIRHRNRKDISK